MDSSNAIVNSSPSLLTKHCATIDGLQAVGTAIAASGMVGAKNPNQGIVVALTCAQEGLTLLDFSRTYHLIDNNVSMRADAMLARYNARGGAHRVIERTPECAKIELSRGKNSRKDTFELTWEDAQKEPFVYAGKDGMKNKKLKTNWATPRARMQSLWARVCSDGIRAVDPAVVSGSYSPEELQDIPNSPAAIDAASVSPEAADAIVPTPDGEIEDATIIEEPEVVVCETGPEPEAESASEPNADEDTTDYTVMPDGKLVGKPFAEMNTAILTQIKTLIEEKDPRGVSLKQGHLAVVLSLLEERKTEGGA